MYITITYFTGGQGSDISRKINQLPDTCPICSHAGELVFRKGFFNQRENIDPEDQSMEVLMQCPRIVCMRYSIAYYQPNSGAYDFFKYIKSIPLTPSAPTFSDSINAISPEFVGIYGEASQAESEGLERIAGVGYRKALEFLIKDYLIELNPTDGEKIKGTALGACINNYVADAKLKSVSERAVWLGNDETHYVKKWTGKDIQDLKNLIKLTTYWIDSEYLTSRLVEEMPERKK